MSWAWKRTFLVLFHDRSGLLDLAEFDLEGRLLWYLPGVQAGLGVPSSLQPLANDHLLVADEYHHVVVELNRQGTVVPRFGRRDEPSGRPGALSSPRSARRLRDGRLLVADTRNHRLVFVKPDGASDELRPVDQDLSPPTSAAEVASGRYLVCDAGNGRVIELDEHGHVTWQFGRGVAAALVPAVGRARRRGVPGCRHGQRPDCPSRPGRERAPGTRVGTAVLAPVRASHAGRVTPDCRRAPRPDHRDCGHRGDSLSKLDMGEPTALHDPHDVRERPNGHLLVVDPKPGLVLEVDWEGHVHWSTRDLVALSDPHSAQVLADGTIVVCDTGNHRLVWIARPGRVVREDFGLTTRAHTFRFGGPRHAEVSTHGWLVVTDTDNNRVLGLRPGRHSAWELSAIPGSRLDSLNHPRWASLVGDQSLLVSDHYHHRIIHLSWLPRRRVGGPSARRPSQAVLPVPALNEAEGSAQPRAPRRRG